MSIQPNLRYTLRHTTDGLYALVLQLTRHCEIVIGLFDSWENAVAAEKAMDTSKL